MQYFEHGRAAFGTMKIAPFDFDQVCDESRDGFAFAPCEAFDLGQQCIIRELNR